MKIIPQHVQRKVIFVVKPDMSGPAITRTSGKKEQGVAIPTPVIRVILLPEVALIKAGAKNVWINLPDTALKLPIKTDLYFVPVIPDRHQLS